MTSDCLSIANAVPRVPKKFLQFLDDWLALVLQSPDEVNEFDLFNDLAAVIEGAPVPWRGSGRHWADGLLGGIASSQRAGWQLARALPSGDDQCFRRWLGPRLVLWPTAVNGVVIRGIVSSRLRRSLDARPDWFQMLRAAVEETPREDCLMVNRQSAGANFVRRAAELFGKRTICIHCDPRQESWFRWLLHCLRQASRPANLHASRIYLSPPLDRRRTQPDDSEFSEIPQHDRTLVAGCDTLYALHIRGGGNVHRLLRARLSYQRPLIPNIRVAMTAETSLTVRKELLDAGAVGWVVRQKPRKSSQLKIAARQSGKTPPLRSWLREGHYLTHCTRRRNGPWPGQTDREYQDDLILQRTDADHSALAALQRIVQTKRLVATSDGVRGDARVVSFTAVPLDELHALRVFRPHRGRWDFEPYGLCIEIGVLNRLGARPVTYVDDSLGKQSVDAVFRQKAKTTTVSGGKIEWTVEREWRYPDDLELARVPDHAICLFVPTLADAQELRLDVPWPVLVLPAAYGQPEA